MKIKYIALLPIIIIASCSAHFNEEQKNADSVLLNQIHEYTLNVDGSMDYRYYHQRLYNSYFSFHRLYGETFVVYNPEFQTLRVNKSKTKMADGKVVYSPENAFNEVLPFQAANAPAYNHLREMVITHVGLEIGAIVELDYAIHTEAGFLPNFSGIININETSTIKNLKIIIRVPQGHQFNPEIIGPPMDLKFKKKKKGDFDVFHWTAENIAPISREPNQVEGMVDYNKLIFSNVSLYQALDFIKIAFSKDLDADPSVEELLKCDLKGWDKVERIRKHVASNMENYRVMPYHAGFNYRSPNETWQSNGGTEGEKVILLASLLSKAGFKVQPALGAFPQLINKEIGCLTVFDRYYVMVEYDGDIRFLSAIGNDSPKISSRVLIALNDNIDSLNLEPILKPERNLSMTSKLQLDKKGAISGSGKLVFSYFEQGKGLLIGVPESSIKSKELYRSEDSTVYSVAVSEAKAEKIGNYYSFTLPSFSQGIETARLESLPSKRTTRLELPGKVSEAYQFTIEIPKGYVFVSPSYEESIENEFGNVLISHKILETNELMIHRLLSLNDCVVPVEHYNDFRAILNLWKDGNMNKFLVKPDK